MFWSYSSVCGTKVSSGKDTHVWSSGLVLSQFLPKIPFSDAFSAFIPNC